MERPLEFLLIALLALGVLLHLTVNPDYSKRNYEYFPDMANSPAFGAQEWNPNFDDGKTLRTPDPHAVPRGYQPILTLDGRVPEMSKEWKELTTGEQRDWDRMRPEGAFDSLDEAGKERVLARGEVVFSSVCAACHGLGGLGGTAVTKRGVPPPPTLLEKSTREMSDGRIFRVITVGQGNMQSHANLVSQGDRWKVVRHVRKLQETKQ